MIYITHKTLVFVQLIKSLKLNVFYQLLEITWNHWNFHQDYVPNTFLKRKPILFFKKYKQVFSEDITMDNSRHEKYKGKDTEMEHLNIIQKNRILGV